MQSLIGLTQFQEGRFEKCLVLVSLRGAQGGEPVQAHVNTDRSRSFLRDFIWHFNRNGDEPPLSSSGDARARYLPCEAQIFCHIDPSELGNPRIMVFQLELIVSKVPARLASFLAFEARATSLALKKRRERFSQIEERLVGSVFGHFPA